MQAWHCIAIISITVLLFLYGTFRTEIEDTVYDQGVIEIEKGLTNDPPEKKIDGKNDSTSIFTESSAWSQLEVVLECSTKSAARIHAQAIRGKLFLDFLHNNLKKSPTARELIFSPFQSDFFKENENSILQSLFSAQIILEEENKVKIICKGHSRRSAELLVKVFMDSYKIALVNETIEKPMAENFITKQKEMNRLDSEISKLQQIISNEGDKGSEINVEAIALRSELDLLEQEFKYLRNVLLQIEKMFKEGNPIVEFLTIGEISDFGKIQDLQNSMNQLKRMLVNQKLDSLVSKEVEKNIQANQALLENEIASAIESLKSKSMDAIARRKVLDERLVDLIKKDGLKNGADSKYQLLDNLESQRSELYQEYKLSYSEWKREKIFFHKPTATQKKD